MSQRQRITLETLLSETEGLRRLAISLVLDAASADDLVQDAVVAALSGGPEVRDNPGGWLRGTVRNLARQRYRTGAHRAAREGEAARPEATASTSESVIAAERQRVLLEAIMELEEPYRDAVLGRFIRGLAPRAIAAESDASVPTVKKRIERGLAKLRASLGDRFGEGGAWAVALLPLCREDVRAVLGKAGAGLGGGALIAGTAALVLASLGAVAWSLRPMPSNDELQAPPMIERVEVAMEPEIASPVIAPEMATVDVAEREAVASAVVQTLEPEAGLLAVAAEPTIEITLIALDGEPVQHADVEWRSQEDSDGLDPAESGSESGRTDEKGTLALRRWGLGVLAGGAWTIGGRKFVSIGWRSEGDDSLFYLLAPAVRLSGHVQDSSGAPAVDAWVDWRADPAVCMTLPVASRHAGFHSVRRAVQSADDGFFDLGLVPAAGLAVIHAQLGKLEARPADSPASSDLGVRLVLKGQRAPSEVVRGRVERSNGTACAGATVRFQSHEVEADTDGRFEIGVPYFGAHETARISAQDTEGNFGLVERAALDPSLTEDGPEVLLVVPTVMGAVRGTLEFPGGKPARFVQIVLLDGTPEGSSSRSMEQEGRGGLYQTDREGHFELTRLRDRSYTVRFFTFDPLMIHDVAVHPSEPGPILVTLPDEPAMSSALGVVVDLAGDPVEGARVTLMVTKDAAGNMGEGRPDVAGNLMVTDSEGAFFFPSVPAKGIKVQVSSQPLTGQVAASFPIESFSAGKAKRIEVDPLCEVQVIVSETGVTAVGAKNANGKNLTMISEVVGRTTHGSRIRRGENGEFPLLFIPRSAVELRLLDGRDEVRSVPVQLHSGRVNLLNL